MSEKCLRLVVGLGNPGDYYGETRHNAGFMVIDNLAESFSISFDKKKFDAMIGRGLIEGQDVLLAKPLSFMNKSGFPVGRIVDYFKIEKKEMIVIHDDIDLAFGRLKIKEKGGHGGHKGIRSLMEVLGGDEFTRLRIGVGRSEKSVENHVLGKFEPEEKLVLEQIITLAKDAVVSILCKGASQSMNMFNRKT